MPARVLISSIIPSGHFDSSERIQIGLGAGDQLARLTLAARFEWSFGATNGAWRMSSCTVDNPAAGRTARPAHPIGR